MAPEPKTLPASISSLVSGLNMDSPATSLVKAARILYALHTAGYPTSQQASTVATLASARLKSATSSEDTELLLEAVSLEHATRAGDTTQLAPSLLASLNDKTADEIAQWLDDAENFARFKHSLADLKALTSGRLLTAFGKASLEHATPEDLASIANTWGDLAATRPALAYCERRAHEQAAIKQEHLDAEAIGNGLAGDPDYANPTLEDFKASEHVRKFLAGSVTRLRLWVARNPALWLDVDAVAKLTEIAHLETTSARYDNDGYLQVCSDGTLRDTQVSNMQTRVFVLPDQQIPLKTFKIEGANIVLDDYGQLWGIGNAGSGWRNNELSPIPTPGMVISARANGKRLIFTTGDWEIFEISASTNYEPRKATTAMYAPAHKILAVSDDLFTVRSDNDVWVHEASRATIIQTPDYKGMVDAAATRYMILGVTVDGDLFEWRSPNYSERSVDNGRKVDLPAGKPMAPLGCTLNTNNDFPGVLWRTEDNTIYVYASSHQMGGSEMGYSTTTTTTTLWADDNETQIWLDRTGGQASFNVMTPAGKRGTALLGPVPDSGVLAYYDWPLFPVPTPYSAMPDGR